MRGHECTLHARGPSRTGGQRGEGPRRQDDPKALRSGPGGAGQSLAGRVEAEARIARIWSELLGTENLSAGDSFFDVGGHSLLSLRAIVRLREETGVEFAPQDFFTMTLGDMAERLEHEGPLATAEPVRWNVIERLKNAFKSRFGD